MSKIKSYSVGDGDMFYINHNSDNFTMIDCNLPTDDEQRKNRILEELDHHCQNNGIIRFISTHPDQDHFNGIKTIDERNKIINFYCVKNTATKEDETEDFKHYCKLRDDTKKAFYLYKGCGRKWMNRSDTERGSSGINILWPVLENEKVKEALSAAEKGESPNNISPIIRYSLEDGVIAMWMGDLEEDFMESIKDEVSLSKVNILFAPHHGRTSGRIPQQWLDKLDPDIIVIGEAPAEDLEYYANYNTITQNSAGNINFYCEKGVVDIFVENPEYSVDFLKNNSLESDEDDEYYLGSLEV